MYVKKFFVFCDYILNYYLIYDIIVILIGVQARVQAYLLRRKL